MHCLNLLHVYYAYIACHSSQTRSQPKRAVQNSLGKQPKQELVKDDAKSGKSISRASSHPSTPADTDFGSHPSEGRQGGSATAPSATTNGNFVSALGKVSTPSAKLTIDMHGSVTKADSGAMRSSDNIVEGHEISRTISARPPHSTVPDDSFTKQQKRSAPGEEQDKLGKRRKGDGEGKDGEGLDSRSVVKPHALDHDRAGIEEHNSSRSTDKHLDKSKDKVIERHDKDRREKLDHPDRNRIEDIHGKSRDKSLERHGRERSLERMIDRGDRNVDRSVDKARDDRSKDDRSKARHNEGLDERFHGQNLPPPPPLPPSFVPQSFGGNRRDEEVDRRVGSSRHIQRLSPRHDEKERRRSEESVLASQDDGKRRREEDFRERKRDERDGGSAKVHS